MAWGIGIQEEGINFKITKGGVGMEKDRIKARIEAYRLKARFLEDLLEKYLMRGNSPPFFPFSGSANSCTLVRERVLGLENTGLSCRMFFRKGGA